METLTIEQVKDLAKIEKEYCSSIYMPTHRTTVDSRQDPVRFKNLLRDVAETLKEMGMRQAQIDEYLGEAEKLLDSNEFWSHQGDGLAVFIRPGKFKYFRLPIKVSELTEVSDRYIIKPLLKLIEEQNQYFALLLSQKNLRLFRCTRFDAEQIDMGDTPTDIDEILKYEDPEKQIQYHTETAPASDPGGKRRAMYHGHGGGADDSEKKKALSRYFYAVANGIDEILKQSGLPLVTVGLEHYIPIFREACSYSNLLEQGVNHNPDDLNKEGMLEKTWQIVKPLVDESRRESREKFKQLLGTGKAADNISDVVKAAVAGRIETLFLDQDKSAYGKIDLVRNNIKISPENKGTELFNYAAAQTLLSNGKIVILREGEMSEHKPVSALYRY